MSNLREALLKAGYAPYSYSGRAMYGKRCVAVDMDDTSGMLELGHAIGASGVEVELGELKQARTDSMGRGIVVYWPYSAWDPAWDSDDGPHPWRCPECSHVNQGDQHECHECGYCREDDE